MSLKEFYEQLQAEKQQKKIDVIKEQIQLAANAGRGSISIQNIDCTITNGVLNCFREAGFKVAESFNHKTGIISFEIRW